MPDEHSIRIRIDGKRPPITVGAMVNLSGPKGLPKLTKEELRLLAARLMRAEL